MASWVGRIRAIFGRRFAEDGCPISWQPNALAPVFFGFRDYEAQFPTPPLAPDGGTLPAAAGLPIEGHPCRVFFPSLDGAPASAPILTSCGRYPLIVFAHGSCQSDTDSYKTWHDLPAQLARCGYVVALPQLPEIAGGTPPGSADGDLAVLRELTQWLRTQWEHRASLMPPPATGLAGHSFGAALAQRLFASDPGSFGAFASLSGQDVAYGASGPKLFTSGGPDALGSELPNVILRQDWDAAPRPKHAALFDDIGHWDYLPPGTSACEGSRGPCALTPSLAADVVTMFFGLYLPPERVGSLPIKASLLPPRPADLGLTAEQQAFAGGFLTAFDSLGSSPGCSVTLWWDRGWVTKGTLTKP